MAETAANRLYCAARAGFARKEISWLTDVFWFALFNTNYVPDTINETLWSQLPAASKLLDVGPIGDKSIDSEGYCKCGPVVVSRISSTSRAVQGVIYRKDLVTPANEIPIYLMTQIGGLPVQFDKDFFEISWSGSRVFRL